MLSLVGKVLGLVLEISLSARLRIRFSIYIPRQVVDGNQTVFCRLSKEKTNLHQPRAYQRRLSFV